MTSEIAETINGITKKTMPMINVITSGIAKRISVIREKTVETIAEIITNATAETIEEITNVTADTNPMTGETIEKIIDGIVEAIEIRIEEKDTKVTIPAINCKTDVFSRTAAITTTKKANITETTVSIERSREDAM
ncbi:MAG: hypothetical protein KAS64_05130 [Spirochaetes bacterium]|nr:hypothetical protein [Spirochaetota bacterium]